MITGGVEEILHAVAATFQIVMPWEMAEAAEAHWAKEFLSTKRSRQGWVRIVVFGGFDDGFDDGF